MLDTEVHEIVAELRPHQELRGQIDRDLQVGRRVGFCGIDPAREQPVAHAVRERHVPVKRGRDLRKARLQVHQIVQHSLLQRHDGQSRARGLHGRLQHTLFDHDRASLVHRLAHYAR
jgi:hypothetical protein